MIGLDANILVQLAFEGHPGNARALAAVQAEIARGERLVFPPLIATEFLHVATDGRRFAPPLSMAEALGWLEDFASNSTVGLIQATDESFNQTLRWMREYRLGRNRVLDTHLAAILHTAGVGRLRTANAADFRIFGVLEIVEV
jgi:predicted nucleic acid-binding protein